MQAPGQTASTNNSACHYERCYHSSLLQMKTVVGESLATAVTAAQRAERGDTCSRLRGELTQHLLQRGEMRPDSNVQIRSGRTDRFC